MALDLNPDHGPVPKRRLFAVLAVIILFSEIATFEILMVYPAMPTMASTYQTLNIAWVASIVTLTGATVLPLLGRASDRWGKKRVIIMLGAIFVAGSVVCALSTTFPVLLAGRAMQGAIVGIVALSYSLVREIMPRDFVPIALGLVATGLGMSAVAGPFIAGWLIDGFGVHSIFWFMAIYIAVLMPVYWIIVPETPVRADRPVDYLGTALLGPGVAVLLLAISKGSKWGWTSASTLGLFILGAVMLTAFVAWQRITPNPLIDLRILFGHRFGMTVIGVACVAYVMNAHSIIMPTLLETPAGVPGITYGVGLSATQYALWTCPLGLVAMATGPLGGWISKRFGARKVLLTAAALFVVVAAIGSRLPILQWQIIIISALAGFAVGFMHSSNANLIQDALPAADSGVGTSIAGVSMQLTSSISVTVTGVVMAHHVASVNPKTHAVLYADSALTNGFLVAGVVGAVGVVIAALMRHGRTPATGGMVETPDNDSVTAGTAVAAH